MLRHSTFYAKIGYANNFMIIFFNINLNVRKESLFVCLFVFVALRPM